MHFSRKTIAIIALVIILAASNIAFAVLYMTKNVNISGGIATSGTIEVYDSDGMTPLIGYGFPLFTQGTQNSFTKEFFINNTGNTPVYVRWNISSSSIEWSTYEYGYDHYEGSTLKYKFLAEEKNALEPPPNYYFWAPNTSLYLGVGEAKTVLNRLWYSGEPITAETFTLVMSFYAQDA